MSFFFPTPFFARGGAAPLNVADLFSTDLYTGNGSTQTITNGIDLAGEGGLVWIKSRSAQVSHGLIDTERGVTKTLFSDFTFGDDTGSNGMQSFNSNGFTYGSSNLGNQSSATYVAWTFRQAPRFFDVVTYTGNGVAGRQIAHNLGVEPGMVVVKKTNATDIWAIYHRTLGAGQYLSFSTDPAYPNTQLFNNTAPTSDVFTLGANDATNGSGKTYVAYLWAHDTAPDGVIQCGSYTGNGSSTGPVINLGWEPQWVMIKPSTLSDQWLIKDSARSGSLMDDNLFANLAQSESTNSPATSITTNSTGFQVTGSNGNVNNSGDTYIYMAIRAEGA